MVRPSTPPRATPVVALARSLNHQRIDVVCPTKPQSNKYSSFLPNSASSTTLIQDSLTSLTHITAQSITSNSNSCANSFTYSPTRTMSPKSTPTPCGCGSQNCCSLLALPTRRRQTPHASPSSGSTVGRGGSSQGCARPALILCAEDEEPPRLQAPIPFAADGTPLECDGKLPKNKRRITLRAAATVEDGKRFTNQFDGSMRSEKNEKFSYLANNSQQQQRAADGSLLNSNENFDDEGMKSENVAHNSASNTTHGTSKYYPPPVTGNLFDDEATSLPSVLHSNRFGSKAQRSREESTKRPTPHEPVALPRLSGSCVGSIDGLLVEQTTRDQSNVNMSMELDRNATSSPSADSYVQPLRYTPSSSGFVKSTSHAMSSRSRGGMMHYSSNYSSPDCSPPHPSSTTSQESMRRRQAADWDIARIVERYHIRTHCLDLHRQVEELQSENSALRAVLRTMTVQGAE